MITKIILNSDFVSKLALCSMVLSEHFDKYNFYSIVYSFIKLLNRTKLMKDPMKVKAEPCWSKVDQQVTNPTICFGSRMK